MLSQQQEKELLEYSKLIQYTQSGCVFGPAPKRNLSELYPILNLINVGYYAEYTDRSKTNDDKADILVFVMNKQAEKLLVVLSKLTSKSVSELTNGVYEASQATTSVISLPLPPTIEEKPKKKKEIVTLPTEDKSKLLKNGFDFKSLLKQ